MATHWVNALDAAERALTGVTGAAGEAPLGILPAVTAAVLQALLVRLDTALGNAVALGPDAAAAAGVVDVPGRPACPGAGAASFAAGGGAKLLATRVGAWAAARSLVPPPGEPPGPGGDACFMPRLRACGDVLVMPKGALSDAGMRHDVAAALPPATLHALLARFTPDGDAPDPVPAALLASLAPPPAKASRSAAKTARRAAAAAAMPLPAAAAPTPPEAQALGTAWLEAEGFPLDEAGLAVTAAPLAALLAAALPPGFDPAGPPGASEPEPRFQGLRDAWGV